MEDNKVALSPEAVKGGLKLEIFKKIGKQYEVALQHGENVSFDKENLALGYGELEVFRKFKKAIQDLENPWTQKWSEWNAQRKSLLDPVAKIETEKTATYTKLAGEIKAEKDKQDAEILRVQSIKDAIKNFTIEFSGKIAGAEIMSQLAAIQMRIGSEKNRKSFYAEFYEDFVTSCDMLQEALKKQKEHLLLLQKLDKKAETADDGELMEIMDKKELITAGIEQNKTDVQESALKASTAPETIVPESTIISPKPKRRVWDYEVTDINLLLRKTPELVSVQPNHEKIKELMRKRLAEKTLVEETVNGLRILQKISY